MVAPKASSMFDFRNKLKKRFIPFQGFFFYETTITNALRDVYLTKAYLYIKHKT